MRQKIILVFVFIIILGINLNGLKMLEPISYDLDNKTNIDLGYAAPGESIMVSFLNDEFEYFDIQEIQSQKDIVNVSKVNKTKESIFALVNLSENIELNKQTIKLNLISETKTKQINLNLNITHDVVYYILDNYDTKTNYETQKIFKINLINKSTSTKYITIDSDLSNYWFKDKKTRTKYIVLQPNSTKKIDYEINPIKIGSKKFNILINKNKNNFEKIPIEIEVKKDLNSIYGSKKHTYPVFNINALPVYYFNKLLNLIT